MAVKFFLSGSKIYIFVLRLAKRNVFVFYSSFFSSFYYYYYCIAFAYAVAYAVAFAFALRHKQGFYHISTHFPKKLLTEFWDVFFYA